MPTLSRKIKITWLLSCLVLLIGLGVVLQSLHRKAPEHKPKAAARVQRSITTSFETISGQLKARNGFAWTYAYDIGLKQHALVVRVSINLIPAKGVTMIQLNRVKPSWEEAIERVWSRKYAIKTVAGTRYPVVIDATFKGPRFHHEVIVRPGKGNTDELNWRLLDTPELIAHEVGHMLGEYDEYKAGSLSLNNPIIDNSSIMWRNPTTKTSSHRRHYERFRQWFVEKTGYKDVSLLAMESDLPAGTGTYR